MRRKYAQYSRRPASRMKGPTSAVPTTPLTRGPRPASLRELSIPLPFNLRIKSSQGVYKESYDNQLDKHSIVEGVTRRTCIPRILPRHSSTA